jgi:hypothetical protein
MSEQNIVRFILMAVLFLSVPLTVWLVIFLRTPEERARVKREAIDWKELFDFRRMGKELVAGGKFTFKLAAKILLGICLIALTIYIFEIITINPMYIIIFLLAAILLKMK